MCVRVCTCVCCCVLVLCLVMRRLFCSTCRHSTLFDDPGDLIECSCCHRVFHPACYDRHIARTEKISIPDPDADEPWFHTQACRKVRVEHLAQTAAKAECGASTSVGPCMCWSKVVPDVTYSSVHVSVCVCMCVCACLLHAASRGSSQGGHEGRARDSLGCTQRVQGAHRVVAVGPGQRGGCW